MEINRKLVKVVDIVAYIMLWLTLLMIAVGGIVGAVQTIGDYF